MSRSTPRFSAGARWGWAFYDWANSAFATTVVAGFFPVFFKTYWSADYPAATSTLQLGLGSALASFLVLFLAPVGGAIADRGHRKKAGLGLSTGLAVGATAALFWVGQGAWLSAMTLFVLASIGFFMAMVFYDSLIVDVASPEDYDRTSALGYGLGYLGGGILLAVNVAMTLRPEMFGLADRTAAVRWSFLSVAVWWALFSLPVFGLAREPRGAARAPIGRALIDGLRDLRVTVAEILAQRAVWLFLLAYWLYIDGVNTIVRMAVDFGLSLGFGQESLILALLLVQFIGFPAAIAFGWLAARWDTKKAIYLGLCVYGAISAWAYFLQAVWQFYAMAVAIGLVQGGVQSLSRSYFARLIPEGKAGEYFGIYNMLGKFAAVLGPLLVGVVAAVSGSARLSIVSVVILFIAGGWCLTRVESRTC
ncbi:MFS transporter [Salinisphaera sp. Q1T1-3]|uniref:MFS transporter n=1 Tax=Salinisphaera sp. Q1T1-3 TaxID=2321229 RepID=UPI000E71D32B|nr:MFS transporter [Salinisphaera sp. Q1T1-3]RJS93762.1 MFS transporter [Salinisphaera sp. Q1T1-3]